MSVPLRSLLAITAAMLFAVAVAGAQDPDGPGGSDRPEGSDAPGGSDGPGDSGGPDDDDEPDDDDGQDDSSQTDGPEAPGAPGAMTDHASLEGGCEDAGCHEDYRSRFEDPHPLVELGDCLVCHDPTHGGRGALLRFDRDDEVCTRCHDDLEDGPDGHGPTVGGMCLLCHGGHSATPADASGGALPTPCLSCHIQLGHRRPHAHSAIARSGCPGCHDPHWGAKAPQLRSVGAGRVMCFQCHEDDAGDRGLVEPEGHGICPICHDPHGSEHPPNLVAERTTLCLMCHPDVADADEVKHPALELECTALCHDPHVSSERGILQQGDIATCTACHVGLDGDHVGQSFTGAPHPIDEMPDPKHPGRRVGCSACHAPHGSDNPFNWRYAEIREELCAECHPDTPVPPNPRFIEAMEQAAKPLPPRSALGETP